MLIEVWDRATLLDQEPTIGRRKDSGAPLGGGARVRHGRPRGEGRGRRAGRSRSTRTSGSPRRPRTAARASCGAATRSPTASTPRLGQLDAGLFFIGYQRDPRTQFVPSSSASAQNDALNEYIKHTASGLFACPPALGRAASSARACSEPRQLVADSGESC